jgi:hypothetical protein
MIYMIRVGDDGPVKIGLTTSPPIKRLRGLQTGHSQRLHIIRLFEGGRCEEVRLHLRFADVRTVGEWFLYDNAMLGDVGLVEIAIPTKAPKTISKYHPGSSVVDIHALIDSAGGVQKLALLLGCGRTTVLGWQKNGAIPPHRVSEISDALDIPAWELLKLAVRGQKTKALA